MLAHSVFFALEDNSSNAVHALIEACKKYLPNHPGIVFFACGALNHVLKRPVNDLEFDVALHIVFDSQESHDAYQLAEDHHKFINENKPNWRKVRVFDADVEAAKTPGSGS